MMDLLNHQRSMSMKKNNLRNLSPQRMTKNRWRSWNPWNPWYMHHWFPKPWPIDRFQEDHSWCMLLANQSQITSERETPHHKYLMWLWNSTNRTLPGYQTSYKGGPLKKDFLLSLKHANHPGTPIYCWNHWWNPSIYLNGPQPLIGMTYQDGKRWDWNRRGQCCVSCRLCAKSWRRLKIGLGIDRNSLPSNR